MLTPFLRLRPAVPSLSLSAVRAYSAAASASDNKSVRPFSEIPKPTLLPVVGSLFDFVSGPGVTKGYKLHIERSKKLGPVYYDELFSLKGVFVSDPALSEKVSRAEGRNPRRFPFEIWRKAREEHSISGGVFNLEGEEWRTSRRALAEKMLKPKAVAQYVPHFHEVSMDLIQRMKDQRDEEGVVKEIEDLYFRWSLESISSVVFDARIGCLERDPAPEVRMFINGVLDFFKYSFKTLTQPEIMTKYNLSDNYNKLSQAFKTIFVAGGKYIDAKLEKIRAEGEDAQKEGADFLTYLLSKEELTSNEVVGSAIEMLAGGVDTTSQSLMWCLYGMSSRPDLQKNLKKEVESVLSPGEPVTSGHLQKLPYLKGCLKEAMRLYTVANINTRILDHDIELGGYNVPAGTVIFIDNLNIGQKEEVFPDAATFKPERWINAEMKEAVHPFAHVPFGFGPRMCIGRRVAEAEMQVALANIARNFSGWEFAAEYKVEPMTSLLLVPDRKLKFRFRD